MPSAQLAPREEGGKQIHFQVVFLAFYELQFLEKLKVSDLVGLRKALIGLDTHVDISTGGNWAAANRARNIEVVKGMSRKFFKVNPNDPVASIGRTEFMNLLSKSRTEAGSYDFKQGLHRLDTQKSFDDGAFDSILQTICALANLGKGKVGYIVLGVADKKPDAERVKQLYGLPLVKVGEFYVVGIDREATAFHTNMDKYLQLISDRIAKSGLSDEIRIRVTSQLGSIEYSGRSVVALRVEAGHEPCFLGDKIYRRQGAQTLEVPPKEILQIARLFQVAQGHFNSPL